MTQMQVGDALMWGPDPVLELHLMSTLGAFVWLSLALQHVDPLTQSHLHSHQLKMTKARNLAGLSGCFLGLQLPLVAMVLAVTTGE